MTIYLQDGAATGHSSWCDEAIRAGTAESAIISPFFTPRTPRRGHRTGEDFADLVREAGGDVFLDATTHGVTLPGADNWTSYNTWKLWGGSRGDLSTPALIQNHVELVLAAQDLVGAPHLVPTVSLDSPSGADSQTALALAEAGRAADSGAWQSLAGRRGFWLSDELDTYVGALQQLRSPGWFITFVHDRGDYPPNFSEATQQVAMSRTIDSLSRRSSVVVCHSDLFGLPAVAAGAEGVGTGWHGKQRVCAPSTFQVNDPAQIRRSAIWQTYEGLLARLHKNESDVLFQRAPALASQLFLGQAVNNTREARLHHLKVLQTLVNRLLQFPDRVDRAAELRSLYQGAAAQLDQLASSFGAPFAHQRVAHIDGPAEVLEQYGVEEGFWS